MMELALVTTGTHACKDMQTAKLQSDHLHPYSSFLTGQIPIPQHSQQTHTYTKLKMKVTGLMVIKLKNRTTDGQLQTTFFKKTVVAKPHLCSYVTHGPQLSRSEQVKWCIRRLTPIIRSSL